MSLQTWMETLVTAQVDGPALTAAARASCLPAAAKIVLPPGFFSIGKRIIVEAAGRISCVVTTPGTARFDFSLGGTIVMDSLAMNLNIVAKTNVNWLLRLEATCRAIGSTGNLMWQGKFESEAVIGSPLPTVGGSGMLTLPYNTAPAVGANFDTTVAAGHQIDLSFTQTVATGSLTLHQFAVIAAN